MTLARELSSPHLGARDIDTRGFRGPYPNAQDVYARGLATRLKNVNLEKKRCLKRE